MAIAKKATKEVKETKALEYVLTITLADQVLKGKGATALEALKSIKKPVKIFTKANIELSYGKKHMLQTWQPFKVKRLFFPLAQGILSKQLEYLLR